MTTSKDVAKMAGTSQSTVSRVIRGNKKVNPRIREKVLAAAEQLHYHPNIAARSLISGSSGEIGIIHPGLDDPGFAEFLDRVCMLCDARGYRVVTINVSSLSHNLTSNLNPLLSGMDAIICMSALRDDSLMSNLGTFNKPIVCVFRSPEDANFADAVILPDNEKGCLLGVQYLLSEGHRDILMLGGDESVTGSYERHHYFEQAMKTLLPGVPIRIAKGGMGYEDGYSLAAEALESSIKTTALFAMSDIVAYGAMGACVDHNLKVGKDLSILGFDDLRMSSWASFQLTTLRSSYENMANITVHKTLELIQEKKGPAEQGEAYHCDTKVIRIPVELVQRDTVCRVDN